MTFRVRPVFTVTITASILFWLLLILVQDAMILQSSDRTGISFFLFITAIFLYAFWSQLRRPHLITIQDDRIEFRSLMNRLEFPVSAISKIERPGRRIVNFSISGRTISMLDFIEGFDDLIRMLRERNQAIELRGIHMPD